MPLLATRALLRCGEVRNGFMSKVAGSGKPPKGGYVLKSKVYRLLVFTGTKWTFLLGKNF